MTKEQQQKKIKEIIKNLADKVNINKHK